MVFRFWSTKYVHHLEDEIDYLRGQMEHERQRAERAIDELLRVRVNVMGVTTPTPREAEQAEAIVDKLLKDSEFAQTGNAD